MTNKKVLNSGLLFSISSLVALTVPFVALADLPGMVSTFAGQLGAMAGALSIIGFVVAGIMYISSTANPSNMSVAKQALTAAIIGVVILVLAATAKDFVSGMFGI